MAPSPTVKISLRYLPYPSQLCALGESTYHLIADAVDSMDKPDKVNNNK